MFRCTVFYNCALVYTGSSRGGLCASSKEVEARAVIFAITKVGDFQLDHITFLTHSLEVSKDWRLKSFVVDIFE